MMNELIGRTIVGTRTLTVEEVDALDWWGVVPVLILDNGLEVISTQDDEGNGPGALWVLAAGELLEDE